MNNQDIPSPFPAIIFMILFLGGLVTLIFITGQPKPISKFEKVDTYKDCDVIRYTPDNRAASVFFLDCSK